MSEMKPLLLRLWISRDRLDGGYMLHASKPTYREWIDVWEAVDGNIAVSAARARRLLDGRTLPRGSVATVLLEVLR